MMTDKDVEMYIYNEINSICKGDKDTIIMLDKVLKDCTGLTDFVISFFMYDTKAKRVNFIRSSMKSNKIRSRLLFFFNTRFTSLRCDAIDLLSLIRYYIYMGFNNTDEYDEYYNEEYVYNVNSYKKAVYVFNTGFGYFMNEYTKKKVPTNVILQDISRYMPKNESIKERNDTAVEDFEKEAETNNIDKEKTAQNEKDIKERKLKKEPDPYDDVEEEYYDEDDDEEIYEKLVTKPSSSNNSNKIEFTDAFGNTKYMSTTPEDDISTIYNTLSNELDESDKEYEKDIEAKRQEYKEKTEKYQKDSDALLETVDKMRKIKNENDFDNENPYSYTVSSDYNNTAVDLPDEFDAGDEEEYIANESDEELDSENIAEEDNSEDDNSEMSESDKLISQVTQTVKQNPSNNNPLRNGYINSRPTPANQDLNIDEMSAADIHNRNL